MLTSIQMQFCTFNLMLLRHVLCQLMKMCVRCTRVECSIRVDRSFLSYIYLSNRISLQIDRVFQFQYFLSFKLIFTTRAKSKYINKIQNGKQKNRNERTREMQCSSKMKITSMEKRRRRNGGGFNKLINMILLFSSFKPNQSRQKANQPNQTTSHATRTCFYRFRFSALFIPLRKIYIQRVI